MPCDSAAQRLEAANDQSISEGAKKRECFGSSVKRDWWVLAQGLPAQQKQS